MTFPLGSLARRRRRAAAAPLPDRCSAALARARRCCCWPAPCSGCWSCWRWSRTTPPTPPSRTSGSGDAAAQQGRACWAPGSPTSRYFLFGFSAWWLVPVALRAWLSALARGCCAATPPPPTPHGAAPGVLARRWCCCWRPAARSSGRGCTAGSRCCPAMPAACSATRSGRCRCSWLGFAGSGVLWIAGAGGRRGAGVALLLARAWPTPSASARRACARRARGAPRARRGRRAWASRPLREREQVVEVERQRRSRSTCRSSSSPPVVEVPKSERVAKERQKPLFVELADTKLPQVDLLDAAAGRARRA